MDNNTADTEQRQNGMKIIFLQMLFKVDVILFIQLSYYLIHSSTYIYMKQC